MRVAIYARVSTDGQTIEQQVLACQRFCEYKQMEVGEIYAETASGMINSRKEYVRLVYDLRSYKYEGLVVFKLDRLGRRSRELLLLVDELDAKGIKLFSLHENLDPTTPIGRAVRDMLITLIQLERDNISEATSQRLQALKAAGKKLGRKPASTAQVKKVRQMNRAGSSLRQIESRTRLSYGTIRNIIKYVGVYGTDPYRSV